MLCGSAVLAFGYGIGAVVPRLLRVVLPSSSYVNAIGGIPTGALSCSGNAMASVLYKSQKCRGMFHGKCGRCAPYARKNGFAGLAFEYFAICSRVLFMSSQSLYVFQGWSDGHSSEPGLPCAMTSSAERLASAQTVQQQATA